MWTIVIFYFYADNLNSLSATGDIGRQRPLLPPQLAATRVDTIFHNYCLSAPP